MSSEPPASQERPKRVARLSSREIVVAEECRSIMGHLGVQDVLLQLCRSARALTGARAVFGSHVAPADSWSSGVHVLVADGGARSTPNAALSAHFAAHRRLAVRRAPVYFRASDEGCRALLTGLSIANEAPSTSGYAAPIFGRGGRMLASIVLVDPERTRFDGVDAEGILLLGRAAETAFDNAHRYAFAKRDQERLFLFQQAAGEALWDWDFGRDEIWWSGGIADVLGPGELDASRVPSWKMRRIVAEDEPRVRESFALAMRSGESAWRAEYRLIRADGSLVLVEDRAFFVRDCAGRAVRAVGALRDIGERRRLEEARVAAAAADAAREELEAFNYSVSHDLRAPLRPIEGFSQALLEDYKDQLGPSAFDYLTRIRAAARRMGALIEDLMRLSRAGAAEMVAAPVDLSALAEDVVAELREREPSRAVTFVSSVRATCAGDPGLLRIALENLLSNAWKFTKRTPEARVEFGALDGPTPVFFIKDNGAGFHPAGAGRLFKPFRRLHGVNEFAGTGIGLAIVDRVIRRHGGRIWAEAEPSRGATFLFTLPR